MQEWGSEGEPTRDQKHPFRRSAPMVDQSFLYGRLKRIAPSEKVLGIEHTDANRCVNLHFRPLVAARIGDRRLLVT